MRLDGFITITGNTRAKARALRDAVNVGVAALEELGEKTAEGVSGAEDAAYYDPWAEERPAAASKAPPAPGRTRANGVTAVITGQQVAHQQAQATGQGGEKASPAQLTAIFAAARGELHWSEDETLTHCQRRYGGRDPKDLSKREASGFIDWIKA